MEPKLDVICVGRSSVDLYGGQVGGRLEDMASFAKYVGGSPTNISIGAARLGLASAVITAVGDEHMGRFILETLAAENVDNSHVKIDKDRLTALVILGIRDRESFPLIFYREDCADMGLRAQNIDPDFIASAKAVCVTGTHFSTSDVAEMSMQVIAYAKAANRKVAFDIDYRPNLWQLGGHGDGENRFAESAAVSAHLQTILPHCDLIVGTEEEWHIAGGSTDTITALKAARQITNATLVCKRGAMGCTIFEGDITGFDSGVSVPVKEIEVFNVLGAGDGFMAGFLRGWLRGESLETCAEFANMCGALAVSRHGCAPAYPSFDELKYMLNTGSPHKALRQDSKLEQLHWSTTGLKRHKQLLAFAFDHRSQFAGWAEAHGKGIDDIRRFKSLALKVALSCSDGRDDIGILVDEHMGVDALHAASDHPLWIGRPIEVSGAYPLEFELGPDLGTSLAEWPVNQTVKVLAPVRMDDAPEISAHHDEMLVRLFHACRKTAHPFLLEIITENQGRAFAAEQVPQLIAHYYELGIYPEWWKLEPSADPAYWQACADRVRAYDPNIQGIIILGKEASLDKLGASFQAARSEPLVKGFAIGRTIFADAAQRWLADKLSDDEATAQMSVLFKSIVDLWDSYEGNAK